MNTSPAGTPRRVRKLVIVLVAALLLVAGFVAVRRFSAGADVALEWSPVTRGDLVETVSATGALEALQTVNVGTQVSGTVARVNVDFNSRVKRGDLLALIDPNVLDSQLEQARADLERARAEAQDAQEQLAESQPLGKAGYLSDRDLRALAVRAKTSRAQVASAQAAFSRAQRNREYAEITSPIDGVVMKRDVAPGQTVAASFQTPTLFVIAQDLTRMQILANVDESEIGRIKVGQRARFSVAAFPERTFDAVVSQIRLQPTVTQNVVTYTVVLQAANPGSELLPGMTATVDFILDEIKDALLVPTAALRARPPDSSRADRQRADGQQADGQQADTPRPGAAAQGGGQRLPEGMGVVWVKRGQTPERVVVRQLGSDLSSTAVEPARGKLEPGDEVLTRVQTAAATEQPRSLLAPPRVRGSRP